MITSITGWGYILSIHYPSTYSTALALNSKMKHIYCSRTLTTILIVLHFLIIGCTVTGLSIPLHVGGLFFHNNTATPLHNVSLRVEKTNDLVSCGLIPAGSTCSTTFPLKKYQGNPVMLSWVQEGRAWSSEEFYIQLPHPLVYDKPITAVVDIGNQGKVNARFVQLTVISDDR